ncbi:hypothetical protein Tco_0272504 [Tanacetum coccineum]
MHPLLSYQKLTNHIDGTTAPSATITSGDQSILNPAFTTWNDFDQRAVILLNSFLTEEAAAEVLGLTTAHAIWTALETILKINDSDYQYVVFIKKIRHIHACTHQRPQRNEDQYALQFVEEPVEIMDREVKQLRHSRVPIVKVRWNSKRGPEFTWEREDQFKKKYPHLFTKTAPPPSAAS